MSPQNISALGRLLAILALMAQCAFGAGLQLPAPLAALADATTICHPHETSDEAPRAPHSPADCPICPLCVSLSVPGLTIAAGPSLSVPPVVMVARAAVLPPATAPPSSTVALAAGPRGPPHSLT